MHASNGPSAGNYKEPYISTYMRKRRANERRRKRLTKQQKYVQQQRIAQKYQTARIIMLKFLIIVSV